MDVNVDEISSQLQAVEEAIINDPLNKELLSLKEDLIELFELATDLTKIKKEQVDTESLLKNSDDIKEIETSSSDEDNVESLESSDDSLEGYFGFGYITSTNNQGLPTKKRKGVELAHINQPKKFISGGQILVNTDGDKLEQSPKLSVHEEIRELGVNIHEIGEWEKHTTGLGLKLLEKYGYKKGFGLGIKGQGVSIPIGISDAVVVNKPIGLGHQQRICLSSRKKKEEKPKVLIEEQNNLFTFMNSALSQKSNAVTTPINRSNLTKMTDTDMHRMMSKNQDNAIKIKEKIRKYEESLSRNTNNKLLSGQLTAKIKQYKQQLSAYEASEKDINSRLKIKKDREKMIKF